MIYKILTAETVKKLVALVNSDVADGWLPCGGASIAEFVGPRADGRGNEVGFTIAQAMTRPGPNIKFPPVK